MMLKLNDLSIEQVFKTKIIIYGILEVTHCKYNAVRRW